MKRIIAVLVFIIGIVAACYFGGWVMFIKPIIDCCKAFDSGAITGLMVGTTILKCIFASAVASVILWACSSIAGILYK